MFNKRWKKVLAWSISIILVLAIGGLFAANYAIDKLMTSMADGLDLETEDVSNASAEPNPATIALDSNESVVPLAIAPDAPEKTVDSNKSAEQSSSPASTPEPSSKADSGKDVAVTNQPTSSPAAANKEDLSGYSAQVSTDKAKQIQENVTVKDKADVASIVLGELSLSDIKRLQELAGGGLTIEEKREARSIILGKVSEEQYNELSGIAKKYGVSEGKSRDQIIAEEEKLQAQEAQGEGSE